MNEKFLRKKDIAERMNCGWKKARSMLAAHGVYPVDFGFGPSGGPRWLESAVNAVLRSMHQEAQPGTKPSKIKVKTGNQSIADMSAASLHKLVSNSLVQ